MMVEQLKAWMSSGKSMPVCKLVGMEVDLVEEGLSKCSMIASSQHWNPFGTVHGGILCDLADLTMGMAFFTTLNEGEALATIELKINYLRPAREGKLSAEAKVIHRGRSTGFVECVVSDEAGKLIAKASSTCMVVRDDRAAAVFQC
jgi:uncharacterized protein (TIGR00369 family)